MEGLINPRPLDPSALQRVLVDSFEESVARRLNSVNNGEEYMKKEEYAVVDIAGAFRDLPDGGPMGRLFDSIQRYAIADIHGYSGPVP